ncbi:hypothetical protein P3342_011674 [Pyrenophora teres f. teres]|nr:hypothetical protein P3342_011674 [Pyrenophora teres f. teres]
MFEKGLVYRMFKPVYWSPSSRTALAEAELEYDEGFKSLAAFVRYPVRVGEGLRGKLGDVDGDVSVIIWTTTPWTLPANKAIAVHRDMQYSLVKDAEKGNELILIAASRVEEYEKILERKLEVVVPDVRGSDLVDQVQYENPFQKANGLQPIIHADFVTDSSGTGLVHLAPGHGMDDYNVCMSLNVPAFAPIDDAGAFTKDAFPEHPELLEGLPVADIKKSGSNAVCKYLEQLDMLRAKHNYRHKYPIDWRTKEPVITRATEQWFANVEGIKAASMKAISNVNFLPDSGRCRLESFIQGRSQWCISRQRAWGVPIPALYKVEDDGALTATMDSDIITHIIDVIKHRGIDAWWTDPADDPAWTPPHLTGTGTYVRGKDTMDVWFDSGTSWSLLPRSQHPDKPLADVYLEGTDQHRGWFQSSLLTYIATQSYTTTDAVKAPYKTLITHGFTLDASGRKMSKSLGNVVSPAQIMSGELLPPVKRKKSKGQTTATDTTTQNYDTLGADALRLWAATSDYTRDVTIGQPMLLSINTSLHKYRVTFKWLLGIFSLTTCPPPFSSFNNTLNPHDMANLGHLADRLALHRLAQVSHDVYAHYANYEFFKGVGAVNRYIGLDLSAGYFEMIKDRMYTGDKLECEMLQRVLGVVFFQLLQILAPVVPLLVEEVWDHVPSKLREGSVHPARAIWGPLVMPQMEGVGEALEKVGRVLGVLGDKVKSAQEKVRAEGRIGSGLECGVTIYLEEEGVDMLRALFCEAMGEEHTSTSAEMVGEVEKQLAELLVVSQVDIRILPSSSSITTTTTAAQTWPWYAEEETTLPSLASIDGATTTTPHKAQVVVHPPSSEKCPRCWRWVREEHEEVCGRCASAVGEMEEGVQKCEAVV